MLSRTNIQNIPFVGTNSCLPKWGLGKYGIMGDLALTEFIPSCVKGGSSEAVVWSYRSTHALILLSFGYQAGSDMAIKLCKI
jgi:hypothetical protein